MDFVEMKIEIKIGISHSKTIREPKK